MKILRLVSRILVGLVLIFSGFVKAVDPLGTAYKFGDYFEAFHMNFLTGFALPLAIILISAEFLVGFVILIGLRIKFFSWVLLVLMSYFFLLTLILAITNPVTDCGCFGDFLIISNWETFFKNVLLMGLTLVIFTGRNKYSEIYKLKIEWVLVVLITLFVLWLSLYNTWHLPMLDFRPYHIGANIESNMEIPDDAPIDIYKTTVIYEKNGIQKEFELTDPEWQDSSWTWVETKQELIQKGYEPPIHDFVITDQEGNDITWDILSDNGYSFLLISHKISTSKIKQYEKADIIALFCNQQPDFSFYAITSSTKEEIDQLKQKANISYNFYYADDITLKTMVRSKPGLVLIKNGNIIGKWHYNDFPEVSEINKHYDARLTDNLRKANERKLVLLFGLFLIIITFLVRNLLNMFYRA